MKKLTYPKMAEFFSASFAAKEMYINDLLPPDKLIEEAGGTILGCFYTGTIMDECEWQEDPDYYGVLDILRRLSAVDSQRLNDIMHGAPLEDKELDILRRDHAEKDLEGWDGVHLWPVQLQDGQICAVFVGHHSGMGEFDLSFTDAFSSVKEAMAWSEKLTLFTYS